MEQTTYQRALHLWPEWDSSIRASRTELGYDAGWPVEKSVKWIEGNYGKKIIPTVLKELERLELPPNLRTYWEDCFYCDYLKPDGKPDFSRIRRRIADKEVDRQGKKTDNWKPGNLSPSSTSL